MALNNRQRDILTSLLMKEIRILTETMTNEALQALGIYLDELRELNNAIFEDYD